MKNNKVSKTISPGIVIVTKFVDSGSKEFKDYVDYIDREEAIKLNHYSNLFSEFVDGYMNNPGKTSGLFTESKDSLTQDEKAQLKSVFEMAQSNDSLMWMTVISFDNDFLEENGLYDSETGQLDEIKMRECVRGSMREMLEKEGMSESSVWSAAIHYNTDNIHIHIATVEPIPQRERIREGKYAGQVKGTWKMGSINAGRSYVANDILNTQMENQLINSIIRDNIIESKKRHPLHKDKELAKKFMEIHNKLPADKRQWNYNMNAMKDIRPELDELTRMYIEKYKKDEFDELKKMLQEQENKYARAYGKPENNHMSDKKIEDLYARMGNTILKEMKDFDRESKKTAYEDAVKKRKITQTDTATQTDKTTQTEANDDTSGSSSSHEPLTEDDIGVYTTKFKGGSATNLKFRSIHHGLHLTSAISSLKKSMHDEFEHRKNQYVHEAMRKAAERELESTIQKPKHESSKSDQNYR